jgi:acetolactate synthase-1/2/3 large subunit
VRSYVPIPNLIQKIKEAADQINRQKPFILFGQGVILGEAEEEFRAFVEKSGIPAAWTILGACALPKKHRLNVGMLGMHGNYSTNIKTNECDLLIAIGMRFDDRVTGDLKRYAKQARVIHLEIDRSEVNKNVKVDVAVLGNVKETLPALTALIKKRTHALWLREFRDADKIEIKKVIDKDLFPTKKGLTMGEVIQILNEKTGGNAIVVTDVGQHQMVTSRYFNFSNKRSVTSGGLGPWDSDLRRTRGKDRCTPGGSDPDRGDGGLQMTIQELTINQTQAAGENCLDEQ